MSRISDDCSTKLPEIDLLNEPTQSVDTSLPAQVQNPDAPGAQQDGSVDTFEPRAGMHDWMGPAKTSGARTGDPGSSASSKALAGLTPSLDSANKAGLGSVTPKEITRELGRMLAEAKRDWWAVDAKLHSGDYFDAAIAALNSDGDSITLEMGGELGIAAGIKGKLEGSLRAEITRSSADGYEVAVSGEGKTGLGGNVEVAEIGIDGGLGVTVSYRFADEAELKKGLVALAQVSAAKATPLGSAVDVAGALGYGPKATLDEHVSAYEVKGEGAVSVAAKLKIPGVEVEGVGGALAGEFAASNSFRIDLAREKDGDQLPTTITFGRSLEGKFEAKAGFGLAGEANAAASVKATTTMEVRGEAGDDTRALLQSPEIAGHRLVLRETTYTFEVEGSVGVANLGAGGGAGAKLSVSVDEKQAASVLDRIGREKVAGFLKGDTSPLLTELGKTSVTAGYEVFTTGGWKGKYGAELLGNEASFKGEATWRDVVGKNEGTLSAAEWSQRAAGLVDVSGR